MSGTSIKRCKSGITKVKTVARKYASAIKKDPLNRQVLCFAAQRSFDAAAKETMEVLGYNVIAKDGWIGNLYPDGRFEKTFRIPQASENK